jgi:hypothetical protein|tara:strand:+ start:459 stop:578 length:120 start_codon:yes stop_codon:yes gene_type:complete
LANEAIKRSKWLISGVKQNQEQETVETDGETSADIKDYE